MKAYRQFESYLNLIRITAVIVVITAVSLLSYNFTQTSVAESVSSTGLIALGAEPTGNNLVPQPHPDNITAAEGKYSEYLEAKAEEERRQQQFAADVEKVLNYLYRINSPVATEEIATKIVKHSQDNGADYRVVIAIMVIESGACRQSFNHNCFGYLNGVKYPDYPTAFDALVPKVSRQYAAVYGWNFEALSQAYGQHNWQHHSKNMRYVASSI